jgi:hypothetical protein
VNDPADTATDMGLRPPPWPLTGMAWLGWFPTVDPWQPPPEFKPVGGGRGAVISVFRFDGDPHYDELTIASPVRRGARIAMFARRCWVSDPRVAHLKRTNWAIDAAVAQFTWTPDNVEVDAGGEKLLSVRLPVAPSRSAPLLPPLPAPGFVLKDGEPVLIGSKLRGRIGRGTMTVAEPARTTSAALPAFARTDAKFGMSVRIVELTLPPIESAPSSPR